MIKDLRTWGYVAYILVLIGGVVLGVVGLGNINIIGLIFGKILSRIIFIIIGVSAIYLIYLNWFLKETTIPPK